MKWENITKQDIEDKLYDFVNDFHIVGKAVLRPEFISASYFLRLLQKGASERAHGHSRYGNGMSDENSNELYEYRTELFDHGELWKLDNGAVICTAMPYSDEEVTKNEFIKFKNKYSFPDSIIIRKLDDKYKYSDSGDFMIEILAE